MAKWYVSAFATVTSRVMVLPMGISANPTPECHTGATVLLRSLYWSLLGDASASKEMRSSGCAKVPVRQVFLTSGRNRTLRLGGQTVELRHAPPWQLVHPERAAGEAIRSLAWAGPSGAREALSRLRKTLPAAELQALVATRARMPTWLAGELGTLVARA